ncbi:response regulator transcription factor [Adlercreutzia equolifaciens]|uniref:response regulator transcription factor n=1 Tax=Adlercreutzia equolifaciens TaxID=446660 RepID=UPI00266BF79E|nr:helix-turn-helix transcriptional regulator [Adlercreutzia equolifaciens]
MEASHTEFESSDAREGLAPSALFDRPLLKYVGFALLLAWHYVLWFVPNFFFHTQLLDKSVTLSWVASLLLTAVFLFILAGLLGRKRHLSDYPIVLPAAMIAASSGTVALGFFPFHLAPAGLYLVAIIILSVSEATLWILWGERYACVKANFTINHIGTVFGITLFLCVFVASLLPPMITAPAAALLPLASGALLAFARKDEKRAFPVLLPRSATSSGFKNMLGVGFVTLLACAACYFLSCIIPWEVLPTGEDSFTFGILGGALFILVIAGIYTLSRNRLNIFKIYPALLIAIMVGFSLFLSSMFAYFPAFIVGIGVQSLFEVLLIMYFGILTTKGYATPALTFAMAGGFVRLGLATGNSLALWYESMAVPVTQALTPPTCLAFMCLLAVVLVPLVRMEFSIVALTAAPPTRNEVEEICAEAAAEFGLSAREAEILLLIARGHTTNSMAEKLVISPYTVNTHIRHIYDKMQIHKRSELLNYLNMQRSDF